MKKIAFLVLALTFFSQQGIGQPPAASNQDSARIAWFTKAKLGIFMHWGVYSTGKTSESWDFFNGKISRNDYMAQAKEFTAKNFDPAKWADLFVRSGAKYVVLTAMHHDGVALWDTKVNANTIRNLTPCKRDLIGEYVAAMRNAGLKAGIYYSHVDWSNPDYMWLTQSLTKSELEEKWKVPYKYSTAWTERNSNGYNGNKKFTPEEKLAWNRFISGHDRQLDELLTNYGKIDLFWFDFMYPNVGDFVWNEKELKQKFLQKNPDLIVNGRMGKYGDYQTAEKGLPIIAPNGPWEFCETLSNSWGYRLNDTNYKSPRQLVRMLVECISMGGNFLLNIGPKADGTFDPENEKRLLELGQWVKKHEEAVSETERGLLPGHFWGPTTLSPDKKTLFLYLYDDPKEDIQIKGIRNKPKAVTVLGYPDQPLMSKRLSGADWANIPGILTVKVPRELLDDKVTVVKIEFNEPISLYREKGRDIVVN